MGFRSLFRLNIRQKVIIGVTVCLMVIGAVGLMSYNYLQRIEQKVHLLAIAEDLSNTILEMRRYEKNYFLYNQPRALEENIGYVEHGFGIFDKNYPYIKELRAEAELDQIKQELEAYYDLVVKIRVLARTKSNTDVQIQKLAEPLRERGKTLIDLTQRLLDMERKRILKIIHTLKTQLLTSLIVMLFFGGLLIPFVSYKIIRPLRVIENTTVRIARGDFKPLPVLETHDETQRVVEAFNRMVKELERRQDQLVQARKLTSIGILTSGVAHQLNNPLNNISTSCQILLEELNQADREFLQKMLTNIEQEVLRARDIVRGLLEFSRVKKFSLAPVPLKDVVDRSIRLISSQVPPNATIERDIPEDLVVHIDSQRIQQVFLNLLMNSIQAFEMGPGQIVIRGRVDAQKQQAVIEFEDTGVGIDEENLAAIFDPFFTTKKVGVGTGLGLSIVYGIIEQHRGTISVESKVGKGTRFTIRLPISPDPKGKSSSI